MQNLIQVAISEAATEAAKLERMLSKYSSKRRGPQGPRVVSEATKVAKLVRALEHDLAPTVPAPPPLMDSSTSIVAAEASTSGGDGGASVAGDNGGASAGSDQLQLVASVGGGNVGASAGGDNVGVSAAGGNGGVSVDDGSVEGEPARKFRRLNSVDDAGMPAKIDTTQKLRLRFHRGRGILISKQLEILEFFDKQPPGRGAIQRVMQVFAETLPWTSWSPLRWYLPCGAHY